MSDYQRARSPEQKAERLNAIMDATEHLFHDLPYHEINMGLIAKELGWSRSNLYRYAATQEEIFLALHNRSNGAFLTDVVESLADAPVPNDVFARRWADASARHADFIRYQDILIAIIESNASLEKLVEFKRDFRRISSPVIELLQCQVGCTSEEAHDLYLRLIYQAPGLYHHYHCAEKTAEAMEIAGLPRITGSFVDAYGSFIEMCLQNAKQTSSKD